MLFRSRAYLLLEGVPGLAIPDGQAAPVYRQDYREYYAGFRTEGSVMALVRFLAMGPLTEKGRAFGRLGRAAGGGAAPQELPVATVGWRLKPRLAALLARLASSRSRVRCS